MKEMLWLPAGLGIMYLGIAAISWAGGSEGADYSHLRRLTRHVGEKIVIDKDTLTIVAITKGGDYKMSNGLEVSSKFKTLGDE